MWIVENNLAKQVLGLIYPPNYTCINCAKEIKGDEIQIGLCSICLRELSLIVGENMGRKKFNFANGLFFDLSYSAILYTGLTKELIHRLKYYGERSLVYSFVEIMYRNWPVLMQRIKWDGIIPVPMHPKRLRERGYNQAVLLAQGLSFYLGLPCCEWVLRVKETMPQNMLNPDQRQANIEGAFVLPEEFNVTGGNWLIVDDILTTGVTVNQISQVLKQAGAKLVGIYTLASGTIDVYL